jgi:hypothetical protein
MFWSARWHLRTLWFAKVIARIIVLLNVKARCLILARHITLGMMTPAVIFTDSPRCKDCGFIMLPVPLPGRGLVPCLLALILPFVLGNEEEGEVEHFQVFHVEWPRVEVPYVVFVWILTTTFVKLGEPEQ